MVSFWLPLHAISGGNPTTGGEMTIEKKRVTF